MKMTEKMGELQFEVLNWAYCPWETFIENVSQAIPMKEFAEAVEECESIKDMHSLINQFV